MPALVFSTPLHRRRGHLFSRNALRAIFGSENLGAVLSDNLFFGITEYELRALRASDGRRLWSTDNLPALRGLTIASNPAIAGRYVYALAVDAGEQSDRMALLALDISSGKLLWRSEIGSVMRRGGGRFSRSRDPVLDALDPWQNLTAPCVDSDTVYVAPT